MHLPTSPLDELRVPVQRALVEVQTDRERRKAVIFLPPQSSPRDFFEENLAFFPAEEGGAIRLYARASVAFLVVDGGEGGPASLSRLGVPYETRAIAVHLRNGEVVSGTLISTYGRSRTLDLVNHPGRSFAVHDGGKVYYVAKAHVERIEETE